MKIYIDTVKVYRATIEFDVLELQNMMLAEIQSRTRYRVGDKFEFDWVNDGPDGGLSCIVTATQEE